MEAESAPKPEVESKMEAEDEPLPELKTESTSETDLNAVESANGTKEVVEACARISGFHKIEWRAFLELHGTIVRTLHALRNEAKGGAFVPEDLGRPSSVLLLSALTQLECQIKLICSCFPMGGVIRDLELIRKLDRLTQEVTNLFPDDLSVLRDIFKSKLPWTHEFICQQIDAAESGFKELCKRMRESNVVCKSAYAVRQEVLVGDLRDHMRLLIIWTKWLCRACKSMIYSSGLQWYSEESLKNELLQKTVVSHKFLIIQVCHTQNPSCLLTPDRLDQPGALSSAFANLKSRETPEDGIDKTALAKQKNSLAVTVYTVLWHTLTAMRKNGWLSCRFAKLMRSKILALDDSDCRLFATINASFPQHVTTLTSEFLCNHGDRYDRVLESLKTPALDSDLNPLQKTRCEEFCLAFLRYAQASTRVLSARSLEVVAWINLIDELLEHAA